MFKAKINFNWLEPNEEGRRIKPEPEEFFSNSLDKLLAIIKKKLNSKVNKPAYISIFEVGGEYIE